MEQETGERKRADSQGKAWSGEQTWMLTCRAETVVPWTPGEESLRKEGAEKWQCCKRGQVGVDRCPSELSVSW